ncbi:MAG: nucleoside 2-deoxyribosyltransferase, partial [Terricaulis sp.]
MSEARKPPLLIGEIAIDFTITTSGAENKLRLGGIAHAARGFWAHDVPFAAAIIVPEYLEARARDYLVSLGCVDCRIIGRVRGAPNITVIMDATEVAEQGYDTLLRDEKTVELTPSAFHVGTHDDILIFPGDYDLAAVCATLPTAAKLHIDAAYNVDDPGTLLALPQKIQTILTSTSSPFFLGLSDQSLAGVVTAFAQCGAAATILKENRGGARVASGAEVISLPAQLGTTVNSVGVGDVFAAAWVTAVNDPPLESGWRATMAAAAYSQTTFPDLFKNYVQQSRAVAIDELVTLGGTALAWEVRPSYPIYLAAPDFAVGDRAAIDAALASLRYHNFRVRRPVAENGELPRGADLAALTSTFAADYTLLKECALVFAVPTGRDPGTLVEIGIAIEAGIPVVGFDPRAENDNTMVIAGAKVYARDLDICLNAVFDILARKAAS